MAETVITIGLISSAIASSASVAQGISTAKGSIKTQKENNRFSRARQDNATAQAEKSRQENLRRMLAAQRAGLASAGVEATSQSALANADQLFSSAQNAEKERASQALSQSKVVSNAALNNSIFRALGHTNSLINQGR